MQKYSRRERDIVARFSPRAAMVIAPNPRPPDPDFPSGLTWDDVEWLMKTTKLPVGLKGIMTVPDARRAVDMGVRLIWVSNHGGRQLDHTQSTIEALPPIADAVAGRAEIIVDGGFNRGTDVIKGVARGADVVAFGRTMLWGLAADGAAGVACALRDHAATSCGPPWPSPGRPACAGSPRTWSSAWTEPPPRGSPAPGTRRSRPIRSSRCHQPPRITHFTSSSSSVYVRSIAAPQPASARTRRHTRPRIYCIGE